MTAPVTEHVQQAVAGMTVYGELDAAGENIVLVAAGDNPFHIKQASKLIQQMTPLVSKSDPPGALLMPLSWPACVQLAFTFGDGWVPMERLLAWIQAEVEKRTARDLSTPIQELIPDGLVPREYQVVGANMIGFLGSAILTDEQRTGKTITTILGLLQRQAVFGDAFPAFCCVPAGTIDLGWLRAWEAWAPHLNVKPWRGDKRMRLLDAKVDVFVGSYETFQRNAQETSTHQTKAALLNMGLRSLVVDEMHYLSNPSAKRTKAVIRVASKVRHFIGLGGTPIRKDTGDFFPTLQAFCPPAFPNTDRMSNRWLLTTRQDYGGDEVTGLNPALEPEFRMALLGQMRRVSRQDVLADLPEKVYTVRLVELDNAWRKVYDDFEAKMLAELPDTREELVTWSPLTKFGHLTRLAASHCDVEYTPKERVDPQTGETTTYDSMSLHPKNPSWKIEELLEILAERDDQCLIFAESRKLLELAAEEAANAGHSCAMLTGEVSQKVRTQNVDAFQAGHVRNLFVTIAAGGTGLTLTAGSTIVFLQRMPGMVESMQAEDRSSGIGSEKHDCIEVIDIVATDTLEFRIRELLQTKAGQLSELVQDPRIVAQLLGGPNVAVTTRERNDAEATAG